MPSTITKTENRRKIWLTKDSPPTKQRSLGARYPLWVQLLSLAAFGWAFLGWLNESWLFKFDSPIWLNRYTEYVIIIAFGLWRIKAEKNPYTKKRLIFLTAFVAVLWWLIPWLFPFVEPYIGFLGTQPLFPSLHTPGTLTFFLVLLVVLLFGRRVICGWNCPCVAIRETVGFPFRHKTLRGDWAWRLRHSKWLFFVLYLGAGYAVMNPLNSWSASFLGFFAMIVVLPYFLSMFLSPLTGNRAYCRYLCPFGATFGLLNRVGFFSISYNKDSCIDCGLCEKVCDMGIPVVRDGKKFNQVNRVDCMGCGRCISECPGGSLAFKDVRNTLYPKLHQDRKWLRSLADWGQRPVRIRAAVVFIFLTTALGGAWYYASLVGMPWELVASLGTLCGFGTPPLP
ncbi:MAG: 4Fe-4S binding protein [Magnetococcales bacterium]|nr:4Fe-4S binding protein [Magnetococcales bacterium]